MNILTKTKDGGYASNVDAYWLIEIKSLFSISLLKFNPGVRENFHTHAFNAISWYFKGEAEEIILDTDKWVVSKRKIWKGINFPKYTSRSCVHKVRGIKPTWALTIRGPWADTWKEYKVKTKEVITLTNGRKILSKETDNGTYKTHEFF